MTEPTLHLDRAAASTIYPDAVLRRTMPAALLVTALLAGCGGDDAGPQTKDGFIAEADGVCESLAGRFAQAGSQDPETPQQVAGANNVLANVYGELADDLATVRLPARGTPRRQAQEFVASVRSADPLLGDLRATSERFVQATTSKNAQSIASAGIEVRRALDAFRAARATSDRLAIDYGMSVCGNLG